MYDNSTVHNGAPVHSFGLWTRITYDGRIERVRSLSFGCFPDLGSGENEEKLARPEAKLKIEDNAYINFAPRRRTGAFIPGTPT